MKLVSTLAACAAAFLIGLLWGRSSQPPSSLLPIAANGSASPSLVSQYAAIEIDTPEEPIAAGSNVFTVGGRAELLAKIANLGLDDVRRHLRDISNQPPSGARERIERALWERFAELSPEMAYAEANSLSGRLDRPRILYAVTQRWMEVDSLGFLAWAQQHESANAPYYSRALRVLGEQGQIQSMLEILASLPPGRMRRLAIDGVIDPLARHDPEALPNFLLELHDPHERAQAAGGVARNLANEDPKAALEWFFQLPQSDRGAAARLIVDQWIIQGGMQEAIAWAEARKGNPEADEVYIGAASRLAAYDPLRALALIAEIGDAQARSRGIRQLAPHVAVDPVLVPTMLELIPPGSLRSELITSVATTLAAQSPSQAEAFIRSAPGLTREEKEALVSRIHRNSRSVPLRVPRP